MQRLKTMNKQELSVSLKGFCGRDLITINQISEFIGADRGTVRRNFLQGLDYLPVGRKKLYHVNDVAKSITERRQYD